MTKHILSFMTKIHYQDLPNMLKTILFISLLEGVFIFHAAIWWG